MPSSIICILILIGASFSQAAIRPEILSRGSQKVFFETFAASPAFHFSRANPTGLWLQMQRGIMARYLEAHVHIAAAPVLAAPRTGAEVATIDLPLALNKQLRTKSALQLGGKKVWVGAAFDAQKKAYLSVWAQGSNSVLVDVESLLGNAREINLGSAQYKPSLAIDIGDKLNSSIVLSNTANRKDSDSATLKDLFAALNDAGAEVKLWGRSYRFFYHDYIKEGRLDSSAKTFALMTIDAQGHLFALLIASDFAQEGQTALFKAAPDRVFGLRREGDKIVIIENPAPLS